MTDPQILLSNPDINIGLIGIAVGATCIWLIMTYRWLRDLLVAAIAGYLLLVFAVTGVAGVVATVSSTTNFLTGYPALLRGILFGKFIGGILFNSHQNQHRGRRRNTSYDGDHPPRRRK